MKHIVISFIALAVFATFAFSSSITYQHGVAIGPPPIPELPTCTVVATAPSPVSDYSMGLAWDGEYLWVSDGFTGELYQYDFDNAAVISNCNGLDFSLRDLTWQALDDGGGYLWAGTWSQSGHVNQIDVESCAIVGGFNIPDMGGNHCNGAAWNYYNDGSEWRYELILGEESGDIFWANPSDGSIDESCVLPHQSYEPRGFAWDGFGIWAGYQNAGQVIFYDDNCTNLGSCTTNVGFTQGTTWDGHFLYTTGSGGTIDKMDVGYDVTVNIVEQGITVAAGGQAVIHVEVLNHTNGPLPIDGWLDAYLFNGNWFAANPLLFLSPTLPPGVKITVPVRVDIPGIAPAANYLFAASASANNGYPDATHVDHVRVTVTNPLGVVIVDGDESIMNVAPFTLSLD
jgi:hypothetical protein